MLIPQGSSRSQLIRRIAISWECMKSLNCNIRRTSVTIATKIRLYSVYIVPVLLYGAETWTMTKRMTAKLDAFDMGCQRRILPVHFSQHIKNAEVRQQTKCCPYRRFSAADACSSSGILPELTPDWTTAELSCDHPWPSSPLKLEETERPPFSHMGAHR